MIELNLKQNDRVIFNNNLIKGTAIVMGIANTGDAILGKNYIIKPDNRIVTDDYNFECIRMHELYLRKLNNNSIDRIKNVISRVLWCDFNDIQDDTNIRYDLGADDLDHIEIIMNIEQEFNISIDDKYVDEIKCVSDLYVLL